MLHADDAENGDPEELQIETSDLPEQDRRGFMPYGIALCAALIIVALAVSVTLSMELKRRRGALPPAPETVLQWQARFTTIPTSESYRAALVAYTASEHRAGTDAGHDLALWTKAELEKEGFKVELYPYSVMLSYPKFLSAKLIFPVEHECATYETPIASDPTSANAAKMPAYNGYSGSGTAVGELIYVNYGRVEDFELLDRRNISVAGRIVIARYGQNFRGIKAMLAEERGAAGVLIYSDPADDGFVRGAVYPDGPWRPPQAIQRGSVQFSQSTYPGDPTTPGYPSLPDAPRLPLDKCNIPQIPVQPISYADAAVLLQQLSGALPDKSWQGGLNFTYALGPGPAQFNLTVQHSYTYDPIWNVIGKIEGSGDPTKSVIVGNHRDAWNFGGRDPASGSAALLDVARAFGALLREGWRPYRTIVLASWDAEEQGLIGSTEWAEQLGASLQSSVLAYINVDGGVSGPYFDSFLVPSLASAVRAALALVADPTPGEQRTMLDAAIADAKFIDPDSDGPMFFDLGSGSDFTPFFQHLGLPAADFGFRGAYGVYHSIYDSYTWMEKFGDPGFLRGPALSRFIGVLTMAFSESRILPFNYTEYGARMHEGIVAIRRLMPKIEDAAFSSAIVKFVDAANDLQVHIDGIVATEYTADQLAAFNHRLVLAEQQFLLPLGLNGRPFFRHAVFAPGVYTGYEARIFPDLREAVDDGDAVGAAEEAAKLATVISAAADYLAATRI